MSRGQIIDLPTHVVVKEYELYLSFSEAGKNYRKSIAVNMKSDFLTDWPSYLCSKFSRWLEDWCGHRANSKWFANLDTVVLRIGAVLPSTMWCRQYGLDSSYDVDLSIDDEIIDLRQLEEQIKAKITGISPEIDIDRYCSDILNFVVKIKMIWADFKLKKLLEISALLSKNNQLGTNQQLRINQLHWGTNEPLSNKQLGTDFEKLYNEQFFTDVTFVFDNNKEIKAHKLILMARSPVFQAMFQSDMLESKKNRVEIKDMDPEIFEKLIRYIYTGKMNVAPEDKVADIIVGADKYALIEFRDYCVNELIKLMNVENAADNLIVSSLLNLDSLKTKAIEFIKSKKQEVLKTDGYKNLIKNHVDLLAELFEKSQ